MEAVLAMILASTAAPAAVASPPCPAAGPRPGSSSVPTAALAPDGTLWVAWVEAARVCVASSRDLGRAFSPAQAVSPEGDAVDANGEARPKIALSQTGEVFVSYTRKGDRPFTGDVRFSRRLPDGRFSEPITVNDDGLATGHRFDTLAVAPDGTVHVVWIDKRDAERSREKERPYVGAALYRAVSADGGRTFSPNRKIKDGVCECCRLALAWDGATPVLFWRDILEGGVRDHSVARLDEAGSVAARRATDDGWKIEGCPHHGPALAVGADGTWHLAWLTGDGRRGRGTFYRRSRDGGKSFSEPVRLGSPGAGRPAVLALGESVWLAWKEPAGGDVTAVHAIHSDDGGLTWSETREIGRSSGASDHPMLLARGAEVFLSWFSMAHGYSLRRVRP